MCIYAYIVNIICASTISDADHVGHAVIYMCNSCVIHVHLTPDLSHVSQ